MPIPGRMPRRKPSKLPRAIGPAGTAARILLGGYLVGSVIEAEISGGFTPLLPRRGARQLIINAHRTLDDQQAGAAPDVAATYDHLPDSGWAGFPRGRSPKGDRCRRRPSCLAKGSG